jgi:hypothetical protein
MERIDIKALSVNSCYQGKRFKNQAHKDYIKEVLSQLPIKFIGRPPYKLILDENDDEDRLPLANFSLLEL